VRSFKSIPFASTIISHCNTQSFNAGDHFNTLSTTIQSSCLLITAPIHSKSQLKALSNSFVNSGVINSENLSPRDFTNQSITQYSKSLFFVSSAE
jgi:hypothetical protein